MLTKLARFGLFALAALASGLIVGELTILTYLAWGKWS
jgi:hypothetical protein